MMPSWHACGSASLTLTRRNALRTEALTAPFAKTPVKTNPLRRALALSAGIANRVNKRNVTLLRLRDAIPLAALTHVLINETQTAFGMQLTRLVTALQPC